MALFRNFTRRLHLRQLSHLCSAKLSPLFLVPLESGALLRVSRAPWRAITTAPSYLGLPDCSTWCRGTAVSRFSTSLKWLHTQSGSCLAAKTEEKETKKPQKKRTKKSGEHGSVLNELMSLKTEDQPKQLTVGAKGITAPQVKVACPVWHLLSLFSSCVVVQAGKDFTYLLVVLGGFAVAGFLLWSVGSEFFSTNSPQSIYAKALKRVKQDSQVGVGMGVGGWVSACMCVHVLTCLFTDEKL